MVTINNVCQMAPEQILADLSETYGEYFQLPEVIETPEDMLEAGNLLGRTMNAYSHVSQIAAYVTICARYAKNKCPSKPKDSDSDEKKLIYDLLKEESELMALRRDTLKEFAKLIEMQQRTISRMITVKVEANKELTMSESRMNR